MRSINIKYQASVILSLFFWGGGGGGSRYLIIKQELSFKKNLTVGVFMIQARHT